MRRSFEGIIIGLALGLVASTGCGESSSEDVESGEGQLVESTTTASDPPEVGEYETANGKGFLTVKRANADKLVFSIILTNLQQKKGRTKDLTAKSEMGKWVYRDGLGCELTLTRGDNALAIKQTGICTSPPDVLFNGTYKLMPPAEPIVSGEYKLAADDAEGTLTIESATATSMTFSLELKLPDRSWGALTSVTANYAERKWQYVDKAKDCLLDFFPKGDTIAIKQTGVCRGFDMKAHGSYTRK